MPRHIAQPDLPGPARLALVTASAAEAAYLCRRLEVDDKLTQAPGKLWFGRWRAREVVLCRCGIGPERAVAGLRWLHARSRLWGILHVGFAGGLQHMLATGDAVWATRIGAAVGAEIRTDPDIAPDRALTDLVAAAASQAGLVRHRGLLLSSSDLLSRAAVKRALGERSGALAVDMESYSLGRAAAHYRLPFASMRTIFDTCHDDLPFPVDVCTTPDGRLRHGRLAAYMARHPRTLWDLPRLGYKARLAGQHLSAWLDHFFAMLDQTVIRGRTHHHAPCFPPRKAGMEPEKDKL